ncbi:MAG: cell division protein BolA [marine bacterium B5-7]|nr:MAG: cell division protein BolA [marine bacterium B5-7]
MSDRLSRIRTILETELAPESIELIDESHLHAGHAGAKSGGSHYDLTIVSDKFIGLNAVARHRIIFAALFEEMGSDIHALSIHAYAPDEI